MSETSQPLEDGGSRDREARLIADQIAGLCREFKRYNDRSRRLLFTLMLVLTIAILTNGSTIWALIHNMEDDMNAMNLAMAQMKDDMRQMRDGIERMSGVMATMETMGGDVRRMSGAVENMAQNVSILASMTPAVQRMSTDTHSMGRDMHWMTPFNWVR